MVFLCGSLAVAVTGIECAIAFMPQSAAFLVATHGAVLGTTFARRASAPERADKFHAFALMCALAAEFFVIMFNTNMLLNYWSSFLVAAHMLYFFVWAPDPLVKKERDTFAWEFANACEFSLELAAIAACVAVDLALAPNVGVVQLQPGETLAPTFVGVFFLTRTLPFLRLNSRRRDSIPVSALVALLELGCALFATLSGFYVQCAYLWTLLGFVAAHFALSKWTNG